jgi:hypothetical protein
MYIFLGIVIFVLFLWGVSKNDEVKKLRKDVDQVSKWCAVMEGVLKDSGVWVMDSKNEKFTSNKYLMNNEKIEPQYKDIE